MILDSCRCVYCLKCHENWEIDMLEKMLIILLKEQIYVFEKKESNGSKLIYLFGEISLPWTMENYRGTFKKLRQELADLHNEHDLSMIDITVVYENIDPTVLHEFSQAIMPCAHFQLFHIWKLIPQILYNTKKLTSYDERIVVKFNGEKYAVSLDKNKQIHLDKTNQAPDMLIHIEDLPRYINLLL